MEIECIFTDSYLKEPPPGGYKKMLRRIQVHIDCNSGDFENFNEQLVEEGRVASRIGVGYVCSRAFENANPVNKVVRLQ
ncbi:hypothetical protein JMJ35_010438 [Cladonia borealis]|uniref:Uncharacterized protein n=1 Tax=Cladonia borealis TaxID=184061 RepID=A0AA39QQR2_9LECA|nr:hypothetical protein JMJ35_010438 [Cladonia borealis]